MRVDGKRATSSCEPDHVSYKLNCRPQSDTSDPPPTPAVLFLSSRCCRRPSQALKLTKLQGRDASQMCGNFITCCDVYFVVAQSREHSLLNQLLMLRSNSSTFFGLPDPLFYHPFHFHHLHHSPAAAAPTHQPHPALLPSPPAPLLDCSSLRPIVEL